MYVLINADGHNTVRVVRQRCNLVEQINEALVRGYLMLVFGMRKNLLEKSETRQNNRSFHMKREPKIAHFMKNTLFFGKMRNWHPNQSHCDASGSTISSLKHSLCF